MAHEEENGEKVSLSVAASADKVLEHHYLDESLTCCQPLHCLQVCSGWLLLEALDVLSPGSVDWKKASKPPFKGGMVGRLKAMENCSQALRVATETLGLQLVSMR